MIRFLLGFASNKSMELRIRGVEERETNSDTFALKGFANGAFLSWHCDWASIQTYYAS